MHKMIDRGEFCILVAAWATQNDRIRTEIAVRKKHLSMGFDLIMIRARQVNAVFIRAGSDAA